MEKESDKKKYRYLVTLRWFIEINEKLIPGSKKSDDKILEVLRHRLNGTASCSNCPTRNAEGYAVLEHHDFMGNKTVYMSQDNIKE